MWDGRTLDERWTGHSAHEDSRSVDEILGQLGRIPSRSDRTEQPVLVLRDVGKAALENGAWRGKKCCARASKLWTLLQWFCVR